MMIAAELISIAEDQYDLHTTPRDLMPVLVESATRMQDLINVMHYQIDRNCKMLEKDEQEK